MRENLTFFETVKGKFLETEEIWMLVTDERTGRRYVIRESVSCDPASKAAPRVTRDRLSITAALKRRDAVSKHLRDAL